MEGPCGNGLKVISNCLEWSQINNKHKNIPNYTTLKNWILPTTMWVWKKPWSFKWDRAPANSTTSAWWDSEQRTQLTHRNLEITDVLFEATKFAVMLCSNRKWIYPPFFLLHLFLSMLQSLWTFLSFLIKILPAMSVVLQGMVTFPKMPFFFFLPTEYYPSFRIQMNTSSPGSLDFSKWNSFLPAL